MSSEYSNLYAEGYNNGVKAGVESLKNAILDKGLIMHAQDGVSDGQACAQCIVAAVELAIKWMSKGYNLSELHEKPPA